MSDSPAPLPPAMTFVGRIHAEIGAAVELGAGPDGRRRFVPVVGGHVEGPCLRGRVLPGGGDWQTVRTDGVIDISARYVLELPGNICVAFDNHGFRHDRSEAGDPLRPAAGAYYFQTIGRFSAPFGRYNWLSRTLFLAEAEREDHQVRLALFAQGMC